MAMGGLGEFLAAAVAAPVSLTTDRLAVMLAADDEVFDGELFAAAREVKHRVGKDAVLPRGLVECSNVCDKDCLYCGIRRSSAACRRYRLTEAEAVAAIGEVRRRGYPAVAFQAGELESEANTVYYEHLLAQCRGLEVTLSLGEQTEAVYRRWREAGALRYLLRIETSNRSLYAKIHPAACSFDRRLNCIRTLKRLGYVTGSGVMIALPGQTVRDLAEDIGFFADERLDMVGMGPYVPHPGTPLFSATETIRAPEVRLRLALRMIALVRLRLPAINIVAATALSALDSEAGRERGLAAGANVIMPNLTPPLARSAYDLYPGAIFFSDK